MIGVEFMFDCPEFTDASLKAVPNLEDADLICLRDTAVTDAGCRELLRAQDVVEVSVLSDILSDTLLDVLSRLPKLRSLQIHDGPRIGDKGLGYLSNCIDLGEIYLKKTRITDEGLKSICRLPNVWSLKLQDTSISDKGCECLSEMPKLGLLILIRTRVTGMSLATLRNNEHLNIHLEECPVTDEGVVAIAERLTNLKLLNLNKTDVGDPSARALAKLQRLDDVRFSHTKLTDKGLAAFRGHPFLEAIYVEGCSVSKKSVKALVNASPRNLTVYGPGRREMSYDRR